MDSGERRRGEEPSLSICQRGGGRLTSALLFVASASAAAPPPPSCCRGRAILRVSPAHPIAGGGCTAVAAAA